MSIYLCWVFWYVTCGLVVHSLLQAWLNTSFALHFWNTFFARKNQRVLGRSDLLLAAFSRFGAFGELFACPVCAGTWLTLLTSGVIAWLAPLSPFFVVLTTLSLPGLVGRFLPQFTSPSAPKAASKEHSAILEIVRDMVGNPAGESARIWNALQKEFANPSTPEARAVMESHVQKLKHTTDDGSKSRLMRATMGRLHDLGLHKKS